MLSAVSDGRVLRARRHEQTRLDISDTALQLFAAKGYSATTVAEIAEAANVSVRTFHRCFAAKEEAIGPALDAGWDMYVQAFASRPPHENVIDGLTEALRTALEGPSGRRHRLFLRALADSPALHPAWLSVHDRALNALRPVLAQRLGMGPADAQADFAAGCVIEANRVGVESWARQTDQPILDTVRTLLLSIDHLLSPEVGRPPNERRNS